MELEKRAQLPSYPSKIPSIWSEKDRYVVVFGEVIGVHIDDQYITEEGLVDVDQMKPIGRLGYDDYTLVGGEPIFTMKRPG